MAVYPGGENLPPAGPEPSYPGDGGGQPGQGGQAPAAPGTTAPSTPSGTITGGGVQSGGSVDTVGSIPALNVPTSQLVLIREGAVQFRAIIDRFEGLDTFRSATEIGELQARVLKSALTDEQTLRKRGGSADVNSSGAVSLVGLHEVSGVRELTLQNCNDSTQWTESDAANFARATDTTDFVEGTASLRMTTTGVGADGDTITHDLGAGATKDLSVFDYVELVMRGSPTAGDGIYFGISEDNVSYNEHLFTGPTTDTWITIRMDLTGIAAASRNAIRYLRFRALNPGATAHTWRADIIRAVKKVQHRLRAVRTAGTSTGGIRDLAAADVTLRIDSDVSGAWVAQGTIEGLAGFTKMRAVDWLGTSYIALGHGGMMKYENGALSLWTNPPPSHFIVQHYEKLWAFSQTFDVHGLRHTTVNSATVWPLDTDPVGGDGGLFYVGRRYPYLPTGIKSAFGQLFLWTEGDLWTLQGSDNQSWVLARAYPGGGTLSNESIAVGDDAIFWHDGMEDRVLMWSGGGIVDVGVPIRPDMKNIPSARKPWTAGSYDGRFYYLSYTRTGQTTNDRSYVFDRRLLRWHGPFEGDWVGFHVAYLGVDGLTYLGTDGNGVRKYPSGTSDAGAAIAFEWETSALNFRLPRWQKRIRRLAVKTESTSGVITAKFYLNQSASAVRTYTLTPTGAVSETLTTGVHNDVVGDTIALELTESSTGALVVNEVILDGYLIRALRS